MKKSTENNSENDSTAEMTHHQKYQGLIKRSVLKDFRDNLFRYFDYIYTMAPSYHFLTDIFRLVIFVQQCIMAFFPFDQVLWPRNKLLGRIFNVCSVISVICPTSVNSITHFIVTFVIYALLLLFYIFFFSNLYIFLKMSKVQSVFVSAITIHLNVLQPYLINMISSHIGRDVHYIIENDERVLHIVNLILGFIFLSFLVVFQSFLVSPSLTFRPQVTHIMYSKFSLLYNHSYILIFFLTTLGGMRSSLTGLIMSIITIFPTVFLIYMSFKQHLWANIRSMYMSQAFSIIFLAFVIVLPILSYENIDGSEVIILVFLVLVSILFFALEKVYQKVMAKTVELINQVSDDESLIDTLSYTKIIALLRYGFDNGHPLCHTWKLFELALKKYPYDYGIVLMYARYAAIYSTESNALHIVTQSLKHMKHGSLELKYVLFQVRSLLQHRERGLSKSLKKTLCKIQDKTEKCRGLMRYTWECVIRGNVVELENLSIQLKRNEEEILREYNQLCLVYPNNPYVASAFSTYLQDIMCNEKEANEKHKVYLLLRSGAWTRTERSYYFAIRHISTLPTEEQHSAIARPEKSHVSDSHSYASSVSGIAAIGDFNDTEDELKTQRRYIESMVNSVKLPTTRYGPILIIFSLCIVMPIIIIPELIVTYLKMKVDEKSLNILKSSALINLYMSHVVYYTFQYVLSALNYSSPFIDKWDTIFKSKELNHIFDDKKTYNLLIPDQEALLNNVENLRVVLNYFNDELPQFASSGYFNEPLNYIFNSKFYTRSYVEISNYSYMNASLEHIVTYTQGTAIQIATKSNVEELLDTTGFWAILKNSPEFYKQYDSFDLIMIKSLQKMMDGHTKNTEIMVICSTIPGFIIVVCLVFFLTYQMEIEKRQLFKSFKAIPKAAVSSIVQQLNAQSGKENQTNDNVLTASNAQEENALRLLSTSVDHGFGWLGRSWKIIVVFAIFSIVSILSIVFLIITPKVHNDDLIQLAPLYHEITSVHNLFMIILISLYRNSLYYTGDLSKIKNYVPFPYDKYPDEYENLRNISDEFISKVSESSHILRFGSKEMRSNGITIVGDSLINILSNHKKQDYIIPQEDIAVLELCSYDIGIEFVNRMFSIMVINLQDLGYYYPTHKKFSLATVWLLDSSFEQYVLPSFTALDKAVNNRCTTYRSSEFMIPLIVFVAVMIICGMIVIPFYQRIGETAQWTLKLLLFCDPNAVLQSKVILKILSNDFSRNETDETEEKSNFYESIVSHLLDGVIFMSNDLIIRSANNSVTNVIGKDPHKIIGMSLKDLFTSPQGQEASLRSFYQAVDGMMNCMRSPSIEAEVEAMKNNEPVTLLLSMTAISATGEVQIKPVNSEGLAILVLSMKDMTSTVVARTLLKEENAKNENLLGMILPPIIVKQLQKGETNICFSVQSASIVFMDIVSFTPWCGANKAAYIMSTLNKLFLYFDTALKKLDKMTKIKCIGDCYMCAGGIFDEVNQPAEHARQAITFGLEAIKCVERVNVELHETLRIRVGCNTGGPIVAGVLGIEKPTFDILGPDINLGAMMEHHGVPMNVHIPQHVYDLGVYNYFVTKERGDVDVKGKMYHTYVVTGYANSNN
ncbi:hypothetical protein M9Y10_001925 [Tritrichomonas musculus]|uniref:Adenylate and Guanylate cyclase catalytic domain containing protein n=1 Tax=Tritrichomonas musculus TaxID=1915356 RepID=A0ABR2L8C9_9EUKA